MKIKGLTKITKDLDQMLTDIADKMDELEGDEPLYEKLDQAYMSVDAAHGELLSIKEI